MSINLHRSLPCTAFGGVVETIRASELVSPACPIVTYQSADTRSGTSGFGVVIAFIKSSTTLLPDFFPASSISFNFASDSFSASCSACLLPLVCCISSQTCMNNVRSERTLASYSLNSSSFFFLYSSISFWASAFASFTRFVLSKRH